MATFKVSQKRENKKGEAPIYISFYLNREKIEVPVRICVTLVFFDKEVKGLTIMPKEGPSKSNFTSTTNEAYYKSKGNPHNKYHNINFLYQTD